MTSWGVNIWAWTGCDGVGGAGGLVIGSVNIWAWTVNRGGGCIQFQDY